MITDVHHTDVPQAKFMSTRLTITNKLVIFVINKVTREGVTWRDRRHVKDKRRDRARTVMFCGLINPFGGWS